MSPEPSQITNYSFKPFIDLTDEEIAKLSPMTRNAKNLVYVSGFLANTKQNKNGWRITDNKYIGANEKVATGRPLIFGPKRQGKYDHPNYYRDLEITNDPEIDRQNFLDYQEFARIGDIFRMKYNEKLDRWDFNGAVSHPNIVESVMQKKLQLPKYLSPYFWNLNDPADTGEEIRETELFHTAFVDDPAYTPEVARVYDVCDSSEGTTCMAKILGMGASQIKEGKESTAKPLCACGLMASFENKLDSSFYVEDPKFSSNQNMSDSNTNNNNQSNNNNQQSPGDQEKNDALNKMKEYDKLASEGKSDLNKEGGQQDNTNNKSKNPTIPVEFQDLVNLQIEKERTALGRQHMKALEEKENEIKALQKTIGEYHSREREGIIGKYINKDMFKDKETFERRVKYYQDFATEFKLPNDKLEELLKDSYAERKITSESNTKGKGASLNLNPFGNDNDLGTLQQYPKGIGASSGNGDQAEDDNDNDEANERGEDQNSNNKGAAILGAF